MQKTASKKGRFHHERKRGFTLEPKQSVFSKGWVVVLCACIATALWGSATPAIKIGYELFRITPDDLGTKMLFAGVRFCAAGLLTLLFTTIWDKKLPIPKKADLLPLSLLAIVQTTLQYIFFYIGLTYTTGAKGSLFSSVSGFLVVLAAPLVYKNEKLTGAKLLGCLLAVGGLVAINMGGGIGELAGFKIQGEGFVLMASVCNAVSFFYSKRVTRTRDPKLVTGWQLLIGGVFLLLIGFGLGGQLVFNSWQCFLSMGYLALLSAVAYTLWSILLANNPVSRVSIYHLLTPLFGTALSGLVLGETIFTLPNLAALVLVCSGVYLVNRLPRSGKPLAA